MRRYSRMRDMAPRNTLYSGTGSGHWRPGRPPPSTEMESARRPISAVPWSMRRRSSKTSGLRPWSSSISRSSLACWWTMAWTRRAMLTKERCAESRMFSSRSTILSTVISKSRCGCGSCRQSGSVSTTWRITSRGFSAAAGGAWRGGSPCRGAPSRVFGRRAAVPDTRCDGRVRRAGPAGCARVVPLRPPSRSPGVWRRPRTSRRRSGLTRPPGRRRPRSLRPSLWQAATARARREVHGHREAIEHSPCMPSKTGRLGDQG